MLTVLCILGVIFAVAFSWAVYRLSGQVGLLRRDVGSVRRDVEDLRRELAEKEVNLDAVISGPPSVRGDSIRDWLQHYTRGQYRFADAVEMFYTAASDSPVISPYFSGVDLDQLKKHFTATLIMLTSRGLTQRGLVRMREVHKDVRTPDGTPITGEVYDAVVGALVEVLISCGVPLSAVQELGEIVAPLRKEIVAARAAG